MNQILRVGPFDVSASFSTSESSSSSSSESDTGTWTFCSTVSRAACEIMDVMGTIRRGPRSCRRRNWPCSQTNISSSGLEKKNASVKMQLNSRYDLLRVPDGRIEINTASHPADIQEDVGTVQTGLSMGENVIDLSNISYPARVELDQGAGSARLRA